MSYKLSEDKKYYTFKLKHPVEFGDRIVTEIKVRSRFRAGDTEFLKGKPEDGGVADLLELGANVCNEDIAVLRLLDLEDLQNFGDLISKILEQIKEKRKSRNQPWKN